MSITAAHEQDAAAATGAAILDLAALTAMPLERDPFDFLVVPNFIAAEALAAINADYPGIAEPGNFDLEELDYGPAFAALTAELCGPALRERVAAKFGADLTGCPQTITVRRFSEQTDGHIHVDHRTKIITMLVYLNEDWDTAGGQLRFLRSATDLEDYAAEVAPLGGTMLAFRRSEKSFHGHKPFVGERRMIQTAWVREGALARCEKRFNRLSKPVRRLLNMS
jgi:hypothetical protein